MTRSWQAPVTWFALFNLLGAPFAGRAVWAAMQVLHGAGDTGLAVLLSVLVAVGILGVNAGLTWWATRAGLPRRGQMALWLITGGTFALTIGVGMFSPINLIFLLLRV